MEPTQDHFPIFEANQVLTSEHLNALFTYLDEQQRLTRAHLIGIGIVCGLQLELGGTNAAPVIRVSKGCGVTSQGFQINVPDAVQLTHYRAGYIIENQYEVDTIPDPFAQFKDTTANPAVQYDLWELFETGEEANAVALDNTSGFLNDKAVILFLELKQQGLRNCSPSNCDDKGQQVTASVKYILIEAANLQDVNLPSLPEVPVLRVGFAVPEDIQQYETTYRNYFTSSVDGKTVVARLVDAINQAYQILHGYMPDLNNTGVAQLASKYTSLNSGNTLAIQYYYDLLRDLTSAYHELRIALLGQPALCIPDGAAFPRHLVLGKVGNTSSAHYRTPYFPSPAVFPSEQTLGEMRFLFERMNRMVEDFVIPPASSSSLRVTPSLYGQKRLSGKSMPYYYKAELLAFWDPAHKGPHAREILSWYGADDSANPDYVRQPLRYDLEPYNLFRVEGHIGKNLLDVTTNLESLTRSRRLPFSVLHLDTDAIGSFLDKHFAIEHEAGALRGGTLVVVHAGSGPNANIVLCDFSLPYRIESRSGDCCCQVQLNECAYEWFDSKKHLINIARHPYPEKLSREKYRSLLAKYYVIVVYKYEIQGQSILPGNSPVQVKIPLVELRSGQISAIARHLNDSFPGGLVFDYEAGSNKLLIRYFSNQDFRVEWGGLQGNQIRYAFTPVNVSRWQNGAWKLLDDASKFKVICHPVKEYCADQYKWLHENTCYAAKYPSPGNMATLDEVIKWEDMIRKRAVATIAKLPSSIASVLKQVKKIIDENYNVGPPQVQAVLVGSWANGSWVSRTAADNKFPSGFQSLRQKVTGKTGPSDIDLLIYAKNISLEAISAVIKKDQQVTQSGYKINLVFGRKDAQKGIVL